MKGHFCRGEFEELSSSGISGRHQFTSSMSSLPSAGFNGLESMKRVKSRDWRHIKTLRTSACNHESVEAVLKLPAESHNADRSRSLLTASGLNLITRYGRSPDGNVTFIS